MSEGGVEGSKGRTISVEGRRHPRGGMGIRRESYQQSNNISDIHISPGKNLYWKIKRKRII